MKKGSKVKLSPKYRQMYKELKDKKNIYTVNEVRGKSGIIVKHKDGTLYLVPTEVVEER